MYSLARANVDDLKKHGLRGEDIDIVQIKAANELPDLEDDVLGVLQKRMDEDQAHALAVRANELMMVNEEEDFEFDFGTAGSHESEVDIGPQALSKLSRKTTGRSRANTNIRAFHNFSAERSEV